MLDNITPKKNKKTEFEEFKEWFEKSLRYGSLPFQITRIGFRKKDETKIDEMGVYTFITPPKYDKVEGLIVASFGLEETVIIPEIEHTFITTNNGQILLSNNHFGIAVS